MGEQLKPCLQPQAHPARCGCEQRAVLAAPAAVPDDALLRAHVADLLHLLQFATIKTPTRSDAVLAEGIMIALRRMLAAAPAAPAAAAQEPVAHMALNNSGFPEKCLPYAAPPAAEQPAYSCPRCGSSVQSPAPYSMQVHCAECGKASAATAAKTAAEQPDTKAARDLLAERRRQVDAEGWAPAHDDEHSDGQMARAASCYALAGSCEPPDEMAGIFVDLAWPWTPQWWKPTTSRRNLVKAGALILAEIERLDRALLGKEGE